LLFCKANSVEWRRLMRILEIYEKGSGQKLNLQKTAILFSRNTCEAKRQEILNSSGFSEVERIDKYLGLPSFIGKSKIQSFNSIKDRVQQRLNNWKIKFLSQAGKEILLKAVVQAIPTYSMSVFLLPTSLCRDLEGMMQRFWWGHMANDSRVHWMSWKRMGRAKTMGGLGFRDLIMFNKALLAKQGWRILKSPHSLVSQVLRGKYFPHDSFLSAELGNRPSYVWKSLFFARELLEDGLVWRIGDGSNVKIWKDRWLPTPITYAVQSPPKVIPEDSLVATLIDQEAHTWNLGLINSIFNPEEAKVIASMPLCPSLPPDKLVWQGTTDGIFSVRSAYHMGMENTLRVRGSASGESFDNRIWKTIWKMEVPNSVKMFMWRACNDLLPTKCNLVKRKMVEESMCPCCYREEETVVHVLWSCPAAQDVWGSGSMIFQKCAFNGDRIMQFMEFCLDRMKMDDFNLMAVIARRIWLRRNKLIFESSFSHPQIIYSEAVAQLEEYQRCNKKGDYLVQVENMQTIPSPHVEWCPPPLGIIKVNWDASINTIKEWVGIGIVARDHYGNVLGAKSLTKKVVAVPKLAEAMAAYEAVIFCKDVGFYEIILEGDAKQVVDDVNSRSPKQDVSGLFVEGIKMEMQELRGVSIAHVNREANNVAHLLAKEASTLEMDGVWLEECPNFILNAVLREILPS
jgi:ribonuclease HI